MQYFEQFKQALNLRTSYGLIALGCLLGIMLIVRLNDATMTASAARVQVENRLARHGGAIDEVTWQERADSAEQALSEWQATRWSGATSGVIAAELQSAIGRVIDAAQLTPLNITVEPGPVELPSGAVLRFTVAAESRTGDSVAKTLAAFAAHEPMIVVDGMNAVFDEQSRGRFSVSGYAPISIAVSQPQVSG